MLDCMPHRANADNHTSHSSISQSLDAPCPSMAAAIEKQMPFNPMRHQVRSREWSRLGATVTKNILSLVDNVLHCLSCLTISLTLTTSYRALIYRSNEAARVVGTVT